VRVPLGPQPYPLRTVTPMDEVLMDSNPLIEEASAEYLGQWNRLVSTTNWEKGRIISLWRERLTEAGASPQSCTDEVWSRQVGGVSPQHVGRLRRVYQRFGQAAPSYPGLFWTHFLAALDWDDAEMWLEGASQNGWSVSGMRQQRWQALGAPAEQQPREEDVAPVDYDEDVAAEEPLASDAPFETAREGNDFEVDVTAADALAAPEDYDPPSGMSEPAPAAPVEPVRPFANVGPLPDDLADAVERMKLAIVQHKLAQWNQVSCQQVLDALDALKQLALAP